MLKNLIGLIVAGSCSVSVCFAQSFDTGSMASGAATGQQNNIDNLKTGKGQNSIMGVQNYQGVTATQTPTTQGLQHTYYGSLAPVFGMGGGSSANSSTGGPGGPNWANNWNSYPGLNGGAQGGDYSSGNYTNPDSGGQSTGDGGSNSGVSGGVNYGSGGISGGISGSYGGISGSVGGDSSGVSGSVSDDSGGIFSDLVGLFSNTF